jgi:dolichyl-phosphate-mannose--protein O-mannosyl transferase
MRIIQFTLLPFGIYLSSWIGWFLSERGWDRTYSSNPFSSLFHYHVEMLNFHTSLTERHPYQASPWGWLVMDRPTSFFYENAPTCGATKCSQEVLALGTPLLWWAGTLALIFLLAFWIFKLIEGNRDKTLDFILMGIAAGYLPWFFFPKRTVFNFYSIVFEPFIVIAIVYVLKEFMDRSKNKADAEVIAIGFVAAVFIIFLYFLPLYLGSSISYQAWHARMWLTSWI